MRYVLFFAMFFFGTGYYKVSFSNENDKSLIPEFVFSQQVPFYFFYPVPAKIKLHDKIDLSFFRNKEIVIQYRFRLDVPNAGESTIDNSLINWSAWINNDFVEISVPSLSQTGIYNLIIEYKTSTNNEIKKFKTFFGVISQSPESNTTKNATMPTPMTDNTVSRNKTDTVKTAPKSMPVIDKKTTKTPPSTTKPSTKTIPALENRNEEKKTNNDKQTDLKNGNITDIAPKAVTQTDEILPEPSNETIIAEKSIKPDYEKLLDEAIEKKDTVLLRESIQHGAGIALKGENGGNIFHVIDETIASAELISILKNKGISINNTDNYGNSPLHFAILSGETEYARSLINQGAELNMKNHMDLSALHLAAFFNNEKIVNELLNKGAEINLKGNTGYTALHIASEMNHLEIAKDLLFRGANAKLKTDQKLTPKSISKIQNNYEMDRLIDTKGTNALTLYTSNMVKNIPQRNYIKQSPKINFDLPYNQEFVKQRQINKVVQWISIPVFVISTVGTIYLKTEANNYYSQYENSQTEDAAKYNYDKTKQYDKYTYICGGVSLISAYGIIHSIIKNKKISNRMCKTYY